MKPPTPSRVAALARIALATLIGLAPLVGAADSRLELWLWLALWAWPAGALTARLAVGQALVPLAVWLGVGFALPPAAVESTAPLAPYGLAGFEWILGAHGLARLCARRYAPTEVALVGLVGGALLAAAPSFGGLLGPAPWPPRWTAVWLDLDPRAFVAETCGVDWLRDERVYEAVGASSIGPDLRSPRRGFLAAGSLLVVGCLALGFARRARPGP